MAWEIPKDFLSECTKSGSVTAPLVDDQVQERTCSAALQLFRDFLLTYCIFLVVYLSLCLFSLVKLIGFLNLIISDENHPVLNKCLFEI